MKEKHSAIGLRFRVLLRLFPKEFRDAYGADMFQLFARRLSERRERGRAAVAFLWLSTSINLVSTALDEWLVRDGVYVRPPQTVVLTSKRQESSTMENFFRELQHGVRQLVRTPVFTVSAVCIVALGIGANTAAFTFVNSFLLKPPAWNEPERVVNVYQDSDDGEPNSTSFPAYKDMAAETQVFSAVTASSPSGMSWTEAGSERQVAIEFVTASFLDVFGLKPFLGSWISAGHDVVGAGNVAVVNYRTWRTKLGGDPGVVGRTVILNDEPVTIVGVGPRSFAGNMKPVITDFWLSISSVAVGGDFRVGNLERREDHWYDVKARLAPEVSASEAQAAMTALATRLEAEFPDLNTGRDITVFSYGDIRLHPDADGSLKPAAGVLLGLVGVVLLLACSNLANLLLVRGISRLPEVAMRRALGASRLQIARFFLVESLLLSVCGGALGLLLARWLLGFAGQLPLPLPAPGELDVSMDVRVLSFTFLLVLVTGCLFALAPAMRAASANLVAELHEGGRSASAGRGIAMFRNGLVAVQVAASLILMIGCALMARSLGKVGEQGPGVDADRVAYAQVDLRQMGLEGDQYIVLMDELLEHTRSVPGVLSTSVATRLPADGRGGSTTTVIEGYEPPSGTGAVELLFSYVGADYFTVMGQSLLEGRVFSPQDKPESPQVTILNETAARRYWGENSALGRRVRSQSDPDSWVEVVGVVADSKVRSLAEGPTPLMFKSASQVRLGGGMLVARTDGDPRLLAETMRGELTAFRAGLEVAGASGLEDLIHSGQAGPRMATATMAGFAVLALMLASLGIYAVVSFSVARRSSELGIRIALGAAQYSVLLTVLKDVMIAVGTGAVIGLGVTALAAGQLRDVLPGIGPYDLPAFLGGALVLALVATVASYLPARRAAVANPVEALRMD